MSERSALRAKTALLYAGSFLIPCGIILFGLFILGMFPFGEKNILAWDLQITYIYYYEWFGRVLSDGGSILYSFSKSLGGNTFTGWASMLASPLSPLVVFFGENPVEFPTFLIILKFGLAGSTSLFYLRNRFNLSATLSLCLSIGYALMLFMTTECICPMFMDIVVILPLIMLGIYRLVNNGRVVLFYISLLLSILFNYYNGYMVCLFVILFYLFESYLAAPKAPRTRLRILVNPGRFSIMYTLAIASSLVILVPVALGLLAGKGAIPGGFFTLETRFDFFDLPRSALIGVYEPEYLPQFYSGILMLIASIWFFLNEKIGRREKIAAGIIILIMVLSSWLIMGERVWLGFRDGNGFYSRFAFFTSALLLFISARSLENLTDASKKRILIAAAIISVIALITVLDGYFSIRYFLVILVLCLSLPGGLILLSRSNKQASKIVLSSLLVLAVSCEAAISWIHVENYRINEYYKTSEGDELQSTQRYTTYFKEARALVSSIESYDGSPADAYRVEKTFNAMEPTGFVLAQSDSMAFGYHGLELYDSTYDKRVQRILNHFGYTPAFESRIPYKDAMIVSDSILGIKYMIDERTPQGYNNTSVPETWEERRLFENPYALPLGFKSSEKILTDIDYDDNPFEYQNGFLSALNGKEERYLVPIKPTLSYVDDSAMTWTFNAPDDVMIYGFIRSDEYCHLDLYDGKEFRYFTLYDVSHGMFPIRNVDDKGMYSITLKGDIPESHKDIELLVAYVDLPLFEEAITNLKAHPFEIEVFDDGYVQGSYYAEQDELLFTTIPYDPGWTIRVNGTKVVPIVGQDAFIVLEVAKGNNNIEMSYTPPGLVPGAFMSFAAIVLAIFFMLRFSIRPQPQREQITLTE